ncbi:MAG TPA: primosomal protein N' [Chryseosolibacter sp.]|nr:primosomal protein N' [Chryseosolibacter sp.]
MFETDASRKTLFAELLLPVPIPRLFTYRVPFNLNEEVRIGQRVIVQFGDRKIVTGLIFSIHEKVPTDFEAKSILEILDDFPSVNEIQLKLFQWMADYYMCTLGEVMNAALPAGLKLSSESMVQIHPSFDLEESTHAFSEKEVMLLKRLEQGTMTYTEIAKFLGVKFIFSILKSLSGKEAIILFEEVRDKFKPKTEKRIRLSNTFSSAKSLEELFSTLAAKPRHEAILLKYLQEVPVLQTADANKTGISRKDLLNGDISESSVNTLIRKGILEEFEIIVPRFGFDTARETPVILLSEEQERVQQEIIRSFDQHSATLLHGVTGSGKTEIYINLIKKALESDAQVLYLLPEIALTTQIVQRLKKIFGAHMGVYHSRFSDNERVEVWNGILSGKFKFVVGVRSSIFLPFDNLGLIIVDEEHDASYKQQEPAPRYHARDVAMVLAQIHHAKVLLGSATPSVESYFHAKQNKYGVVKLDKRFGEAILPEIVLANMGQERKMKTIKGEFSRLLLQRIEETLSRKEQVIIFQNRRGYSPMMSCEDCGWVPKCINCAVSLTYHQYRHVLVCHYCAYKESVPQQCPTCTSSRLKTVGYGTEKLEEELNVFFPEAVVQRMDLDTTRSKTGYETILAQFENGETDILVGTQMVTKGLDFNKVSLVGVFNADRMMHFPDFRSYERAYQLITQVSGRAGRRARQGQVVIQTSNPDHPILNFILKHDYDAFYEREIADRRQHDYPPFTRLIEIVIKHTDKKVSREASQKLAGLLKSQLSGVKIMGPGEPMVAKIRNQYLMSILLKTFRGKTDLTQIKQHIQNSINALANEKVFRNVRFVVDVDPV